ncbi:hypothetical protein AOQ84DRAFT_377837 [Glonium stellatum]|uniref:Protein kinase domain-containing protein n=1 Tax=Glonium stellatum TaxID=574774 RepID=A0A8E2JRY1_9PEZI|nr:hypothetical protein AOQ84DRAFT_377837 [Glonium stellatum]
MIADFGVSTVKNKSDTPNGNRHLSNTSGPPPRAFSPPEFQNRGRSIGLKGNIWSFVSVLAYVLAFVLGGPAEFARPRDRHQTQLYEDKFGRPVIKESIVEWLNSLIARDWDWSKHLSKGREVHLSWLSKAIDIVRQGLEINEDDRPDSHSLEKHLNTVYDLVPEYANDEQ